MSWSAYMMGTHVGLGHHRAEVWIDDRLLDSHEFDIVPDTTAVTTNGEVAHKVFESVHQEVPLRDAIKGYARALLLDGDTDTFERETALLRSSGERTPAGAWKIYYFYHSLDDFSRADPTNPQWATLESTTARWLAIPATGRYAQEHTRAWSEKIRSSAAVVFVTPQYNWGYPAALKNAIDHLYQEWHDKPAIIVTYGGHGGTKCAEQLKQVVGAVKMRLAATAPALVLPDAVIRGGAALDPNREFHQQVALVQSAFAELAALLA